MNPDKTPALIRTLVPILVGHLLTLLARHFNIIINEESQLQMIAAFQTIVTILYYAVIRQLAEKYPWIEILLGSSQVPYYRRVR